MAVRKEALIMNNKVTGILGFIVVTAFAGLVQAQTVLTNNGAGLWGTGANWVGGAAPSAGGSATYTIILTNGSTASARTNNIGNPDFLMNQLVFTNAAAGVTLFGGSGTNLVFTNNVTVMPQVVQGSSQVLTLNHNITLATNLIFGGTGTGAVAVANNITGSAGLTLSGSYTLTLSGVNTFAGAATVNQGTLVLNGAVGTLSAISGLTLTGGSTFYLGDTTAGNGLVNRVNTAATLTLGGASGGGTLSVVRGSTTANSQSFVSLTVGDGGLSAINSTNSAGGLPTVTFTGAAPYLRPGTGGVVNFDTTNMGVTFNSAPSGGVVAGTAKPILIGGVLKGNDFVAAGAGAPSAPTYDTAWGSGDATLDVTSDITAGGTAVNAIRFNDAASVRTVTLASGTSVVGSGMILSTANSHTGTTATAGCKITGNSITSGNGKELIISDNHLLDRRALKFYGIQIASKITDNGSTPIAVTVSGFQPVVLSSQGQLPSSKVYFNNTNNTYSGGTHLNNIGLGIRGDGSLGAVPATPANNIFVTGVSHLIAETNANVTLHANRSIVVNKGAWLGIFPNVTTSRNITIPGVISGGGSLYVNEWNGGGSTSLTVLTGTNTLTGVYQVTGLLRADEGVGLSSSAALYLGDASGSTNGVLETKGTFTRILGSGAGQVRIGYNPVGTSGQCSAGFAAVGGPLIVNLGGDQRAVNWVSAGGAGVIELQHVLGAGGDGKLTLQSVNSTSTLEWQNPINMVTFNRAVLVPATPYAATMSGVISGTVGFYKQGSGTLILTATNSWSGATTISGTLSVTSLANGGSNSGVGSSSSLANNLRIGGGVLQYTGAAASSDRNFMILPGGASLDASGNSNAALLFSSPAAISPDVASRNGVTTNTDKKITGLSTTTDLFAGMPVSGDGIASGATISSIDSASQVTLTASANNSVAGTSQITFGLGARTLTLTGTSTGTNTIAGALQDGATVGTLAGTLSVVKAGVGTWVLSGTNTYTGATTVSNGTLVVNGATTNSAITVVSNAMLCGSGMAGAVTIASGATISAADTNSVGTLSVTNLTMAENSTYIWNYNDTARDLINVSGLLTLPTVATVKVSQAASGIMPSSGVLFTFDSVSPASPDLKNWVITGAPSPIRAQRVGNQIKLVSPTGWIMFVQ